MKITICGSMKLAQTMKEYQIELEKLGFEVEIPVEAEGFNYNDYSHEQGAQLKITHGQIKKHYNKIIGSDAILVVNEELKGIPGYIGGNTLLEIGFAYIHNKDIFLLNPSPELGYKSEIDGMEPIVINKNLTAITTYYQALPKTYVASNSAIKLKATKFALQKQGYKTFVQGISVDSQVSSQPIGEKETIQGAINRLETLKQQVSDYENIIAIENGIIYFDHYPVDVAFVVVENKSGHRETALSAGTILNKDIAEKIAKEGLELGPYLMENFNISEKDPTSYYTNKKISRTNLLQNAVEIALARM